MIYIDSVWNRSDSDCESVNSSFSFFHRDESSNVAIIREVYDSENAHETFEYELERALESECSLIVIEPSKLGDETSRWIAVGNCLHKTAALSGLAAIITGLINLYV